MRLWLLALFFLVVAMIALDCLFFNRAAPVASVPPTRDTLRNVQDNVRDWLYEQGYPTQPSQGYFLRLLEVSTGEKWEYVNDIDGKNPPVSGVR
ncbi:MAG: hypothetical protein HYS13_18005 [Planctomycetia bacterium]|nr:hypothetical protein [Planctomycetia bacterium]